MAQKPSVPKGTRDFLPQTMLRRNHIFNTIKSVFVKFGYAPIETPAMEKTETLLGKYGEEGDRLIFKIMPRGRKQTKLMESGDLKMVEEALRYDLTVPFARFVVQHQNDLNFPFKRYQIQNVWRADQPQNGRYREFFQCDADVVGSDSLLFEVEFVQIYDEALSTLGLDDFTIKINNRKILSGIAEITGISDQLIDMTVAIDKLDKIGEEGVVKELTERNIPADAIEKIRPLFHFGQDNQENLNKIQTMLEGSEIGQKGVEELRFILDQIEVLGLRQAKLELDVTLARGLNYYTGAIFEVKANNLNIGSICGGGRYDDLTGIFGLKGMSGVGISFGADRIYDVMNELDLFPKLSQDATQIMFVNFGEAEQNFCLKKIKELRDAGVNAEIYPSNAKMKKQMKYADDKGIPMVALIGSQEMTDNVAKIKYLETGEQEDLSWDELLKRLKG